MQEKFWLVISGQQFIGKGKIGAALQDAYGSRAVYLSTGDKARKLKMEAADKALFIDDNIINGWVIEDLFDPLEQDLSLVAAMLDGAPRTEKQEECLYEEARRRGFVIILLKLNAPRRIALERHKKRVAEEGRTDDLDNEKVAKRFHDYDMYTIPALGKLSDRPGVLTFSIDAVPELNIVVKSILNALQSVQAFSQAA